ncbi:(2Fe-2S)-binding protein [Rubinisphaera margarita]|uniref:(2Fe-2S)-binding protein n=1 Tax=Rubinisphaera margarita TaxID=2909586 RepID=UPI001EE91B81|nr:(2Fe-2S)-binding protein [Rubinisphaera margarita]MCG6156490.1 (2Fe-2S)-binding protein [Rubinisphaera margarita]
MNHHADSNNSAGLGRRQFLKGVGTLAGASCLPTNATAADENTPQERNVLEHPLTLTLRINGRELTREIDARTTLLDLLRENLQLTGTKKGCDHGACGACTVHVNGDRVLSCLTLAATLQEAEITTIEGVSQNDQLHPLQEAFLRCDAYQCGYCTPGQIMSGIACIGEGHADKSAEEAREWMSGNLCRCSAYPNILAAVRQTAGAEPESDPAATVKALSLAEASSQGR